MLLAPTREQLMACGLRFLDAVAPLYSGADSRGGLNSLSEVDEIIGWWAIIGPTLDEMRRHAPELTAYMSTGGDPLQGTDQGLLIPVDETTDLRDVIERGRTDSDVVLQPDDQIFVPQKLINF